MIKQESTTCGSQTSNSDETFNKNYLDRRKFISGIATATLAMTIVPRHVLGGVGFIAPSDKITLAYIGTGTQGLRELQPLLAIPELQIIAVCDPQKKAIGYLDWSKN